MKIKLSSSIKRNKYVLHEVKQKQNYNPVIFNGFTSYLSSIQMSDLIKYIYKRSVYKACKDLTNYYETKFGPAQSSCTLVDPYTNESYISISIYDNGADLKLIYKEVKF